MLSQKRKQPELLIRVRSGVSLGLDLGQPVQYRVMTLNRRWARLRDYWARRCWTRCIGSRRVCTGS
jgi:hypothetical protein